MIYGKTLTDANIRIPEQRRAAEAGDKHAGGQPKASPDRMGVPPDEIQSRREEQLRKQPVGR
ncbi:MAG: hypothetical protein AB7H90_24620 [Alphaproteobacteria bacterium]